MYFASLSLFRLDSLNSFGFKGPSVREPPCECAVVIECFKAWPRGGDNFSPFLKTNRREFRGQMNRGNRTESPPEGNLPLRGSLRGRVFRGSQRVLRGFQRVFFRDFSEVFRGPLLVETLSEADFPLRGSQSCCP